ncbi:hypothetical protein ACLB2K_073580 [Fragaria x ananassa]
MHSKAPRVSGNVFRSRIPTLLVSMFATFHQSTSPDGLAIFCCMPTTLSSGVALTQLAGANTALALAMTVISNLLGILIVPFSISKFIADGVGVSVPTKQIFRESFRGVADFVDQNRKNLSKISAILLSLALLQV